MSHHTHAHTCLSSVSYWYTVLSPQDIRKQEKYNIQRREWASGKLFVIRGLLRYYCTQVSHEKMWQPNRHYTSNYDCGYSEIFQRKAVEFCLEYEMAWKRKIVSQPPRKLFSIYMHTYVHAHIVCTYVHTYPLCIRYFSAFRVYELSY